MIRVEDEEDLNCLLCNASETETRDHLFVYPYAPPQPFENDHIVLLESMGVNEIDFLKKL